MEDSAGDISSIASSKACLAIGKIPSESINGLNPPGLTLT